MFRGKILVQNTCPLENIQVTVQDDWFSYPPKLQEHIDTIREAKVLESEQKWSKLWDGNNYRLVQYESNPTSLQLDLGYVKYRNARVTKFLLEDISKLPTDQRANSIFVSWYIHTQDKYSVRGERSARYLCKDGEIEIIGGVLQPDEILVSTIQDILNWFLKEVEEETGVPAEYTQNPHLVGITQSEHLNIGIIFQIDIALTKDEVLQKFHEKNDLEMKNLLFIPQDKTIDFLNTLGTQEGESINNMGLYAKLYKNNFWT